MIIIYCDSCGQRVPDADVREGRAVHTADNTWYCAGCAPATGRPMKPPPSGGQARRAPAPRAVEAPRSDPRHQEREPKTGSNHLVIGLACAGVVLLGIGIYLMAARKRAPRDEPEVAATTPAKETPRETAATPKTTVPNSTPGTPVKPVATAPGREQPARPASGEGTKPLPTTELTPAERVRQADREMEDFRNQRATKLLDEAIAWRKQNPSDPWTYQGKLREISTSYGSAPAAVEARKLLEELKSLPPPPDRLEATVSESREYQLVYDIDLSKPGSYVADNRAQIKGGFDRIAYFMELQPGAGEVQYLYVSLDAFSDDLGKIGIPTTASGARFQQNVANMNVYSNVKGIVTGTGIAGGNIEFWPSNYGPNNSKNVPNAVSDKYDFGDDVAQGEGYGSMQVHNHDAKQTLFAFNHWSTGAGADIGIGNQPANNPDWTFSGSAGSYRTKRLRVLVRGK